MVVGIIFSIYVLGILPILLGGALRTVQRVRRVELSELYAVGWAVMLALAAIPLIYVTDRDIAPSEIGRIFVIISLIIGVLSFGIGFKRLMTAVILAVRRVRLNIPDVLWLIVIVLSVIFVVPQISDTTIGTVHTAVFYDSFYGHDVYTGETLDVIMPHHSPIEALYTLMALLSGACADIFITRILAVFMLISAWCVYDYAARVFFGHARAGRWFKIIALLFFTIELFRNGGLQTALFMNVWNGLTYVCGVLFPLAFTDCIALCNRTTVSKGKATGAHSAHIPISVNPKRKLLAVIISACVFSLAAQLLAPAAGGVMIFMWIVLGVISYVA